MQLVCYIILYIPLDGLCVTVSLHQEPIPDEQYNPQEIEDLPDTDLHLDGTYFVNYKCSSNLFATLFLPQIK